MNITDFENLIESIWQEVLPLYEHLHCYVGEKLSHVYGKEKTISKEGLVSAHLLGFVFILFLRVFFRVFLRV
jgi:peptidyl-dipeptidase A